MYSPVVEWSDISMAAIGNTTTIMVMYQKMKGTHHKPFLTFPMKPVITLCLFVIFKVLEICTLTLKFVRGLILTWNRNTDS